MRTYADKINTIWYYNSIYINQKCLNLYDIILCSITKNIILYSVRTMRKMCETIFGQQKTINFYTPWNIHSLYIRVSCTKVYLYLCYWWGRCCLDLYRDYAISFCNSYFMAYYMSFLKINENFSYSVGCWVLRMDNIGTVLDSNANIFLNYSLKKKKTLNNFHYWL